MGLEEKGLGGATMVRPFNLAPICGLFSTAIGIGAGVLVVVAGALHSKAHNTNSNKTNEIKQNFILKIKVNCLILVK
jgi:hypothetical protein